MRADAVANLLEFKASIRIVEAECDMVDAGRRAAGLLIITTISRICRGCHRWRENAWLRSGVRGQTLLVTTERQQ